MVNVQDKPVGMFIAEAATEAGVSELYNLTSDPLQLETMIAHKPELAKELHQCLVRFMRETGLPDLLLRPRLELRL